jgi:hypothetical protein
MKSGFLNPVHPVKLFRVYCSAIHESLSVLQGGDALMARRSRNRKDASSAKTQENVSQPGVFAPFPRLCVPGLVRGMLDRT